MQNGVCTGLSHLNAQKRGLPRAGLIVGLHLHLTCRLLVSQHDRGQVRSHLGYSFHYSIRKEI